MTNDNKKSPEQIKREIAAEIIKMTPRDQIAVLARNIALEKRPNMDKIGMGVHALVRLAFVAGMRSMMTPSTKLSQQRLDEWLDKAPHQPIIIKPGDTVQ